MFPWWFLMFPWCFLDGFWCFIDGFWCFLDDFWFFLDGFWCFLDGFWCFLEGFWCFIDRQTRFLSLSRLMTKEQKKRKDLICLLPIVWPAILVLVPSGPITFAAVCVEQMFSNICAGVHVGLQCRLQRRGWKLSFIHKSPGCLDLGTVRSCMCLCIQTHTCCDYVGTFCTSTTDREREGYRTRF